MIRPSSYIILCLCLSCFKLLFLKSYVSTDFDVHRNWMSITYNLPLNDWYYDTTSEWTLDYPPLFAIFELALAFFAHLFNIEDALVLSKQPIRSNSVIVYQKITVILSDFVHFYGVYKLCNSLETLLCGLGQADGSSARPKNIEGAEPCEKPPEGAKAHVLTEYYETLATKGKNELPASKRKSPSPTPTAQATSTVNTVKPELRLNLAESLHRPDATSCTALLLLLQPGLLMVDHVHFQYNGLLSGVLLISIANVLDRRFMAASFWFAVLLNLKHIYLYCAPAYGMYLLVSHCLTKDGGKLNRIWIFLFRAGRLGSIVISVFVITYTPFADLATLRQIVSRLFPFKRGLTHAYWAPNIWSLYNLVDKVLATVYKDSLNTTFNLESISKTKRVTSTSGLVQEYEHLYLPSIKPMTTFILVAVFMLPIVIKFLFKIDRNCPILFLKGLTLAAFTSFMFGWHVHEKAILLVLLPVTPLLFTDPHLRRTILRLALAGTYSLFPLLHEPAEYPIKFCLLLVYYTYARSQHPRYQTRDKSKHQPKKQSNDTKQHRLVATLGSWARKLYALLDKAYVVTLILNELYIILLFGRLDHDWNPVARLNKLEFLPLMLTSTLTAMGITSTYFELYYDFVLCADELATAPALA